MDLKAIYLRTLQQCAPERLVSRVISPDMPRTVVAIGKCAGALIDGVEDFDQAFVVVPEGYPGPSGERTSRPHPASVSLAGESRRARRPSTAGEDARSPEIEMHVGGHPFITDASFAAGRGLVEFVERHDEILFLISGGGSACVELPLAPWFDERDVMETNKRLLASGLPIGEINCVRKHLSAIKGGRLARGKSVTLVYSDVSRGALADVASGPTLPDPTTTRDAIAILERLGGFERIVTKLRSCPDTVKSIAGSRAKLIADNGTLTATAASIAKAAVVCEEQIEGDVSDAASLLLERARALAPGEVLVAGGEPTVVTRGDGKGGRCCELAVRVALAATEHLDVLFGSSDGVDGNSGVAAIAMRLPVTLDRARAESELARSNSLAVAASIGQVVTMLPTGNNLRDIYLLARS